MFPLYRSHAQHNPPARPRYGADQAYHHPMGDETSGWGMADKTGAVLLVILAIGLLFIGADIITGGRLTGRGKEHGTDDAQPRD